MKLGRAFSGRAMAPRAPLALVSGRGAAALRSEQPRHSRGFAPLALIFRRARARSTPASRPTIAARDGGVVVLAPRFSFILNLFETIVSPLARGSGPHTFVRTDKSHSASLPFVWESNALRSPALYAQRTPTGRTWATSIAGIQRARRPGSGTWEANFTGSHWMWRRNHGSPQAGIRTRSADEVTTLTAQSQRATPPHDVVRRPGSMRRHLPQASTKDPAVRLDLGVPLPERWPGIRTFKRASERSSPVKTRFGRSAWSHRLGVNEQRSPTGLPDANKPFSGNRRGRIETLIFPATRYPGVTEIAHRQHPAAAQEQFRAVAAVPLTHRTTKAASPAPLPPRAALSEPARPAIDAERLGREIWQQMGRRVRIERERRGRL
jgi:hypothetical protein